MADGEETAKLLNGPEATGVVFAGPKMLLSDTGVQMERFIEPNSDYLAKL